MGNGSGPVYAGLLIAARRLADQSDGQAPNALGTVDQDTLDVRGS